MKMNSELNKETLEFFYREYKGLILPVVAILVSIFLILIFLLPQLLGIPAKKSEMDLENVKLNKLKDVAKILSSADIPTVEENLGTVGKVLPVEKNFESILGGIFSAANSTSVLITGYNYMPENVGLNAKTAKFPVVKFSVEITGDPLQVVEFLNKIYETFPISETESIQIGDNVSNITLAFFYKPFTPSNAEDRTKIRNLTSNEKNVLNQITAWTGDSQSALGDINVVPDSSSNSAILDSSPF